MLAVLGLDDRDPVWQRTGGQDEQLGEVVDGLVGELLKQRADARVRKDFTAADAIRASLAQLGVEIADTPQGPKWSLRTNRSEA
jgi:cysteinyl-tRNA synthetase